MSPEDFLKLLDQDNEVSAIKAPDDMCIMDTCGSNGLGASELIADYFPDNIPPEIDEPKFNNDFTPNIPGLS